MSSGTGTHHFCNQPIKFQSFWCRQGKCVFTSLINFLSHWSVLWSHFVLFAYRKRTAENSQKFKFVLRGLTSTIWPDNWAKNLEHFPCEHINGVRGNRISPIFSSFFFCVRFVQTRMWSLGQSIKRWFSYRTVDGLYHISGDSAETYYNTKNVVILF